MPLFEYECQECRHGFEVLQIKRGDENEIKCPQCGSVNVVKLLSSFSSKSNAGGKAASCSPSSFS